MRPALKWMQVASLFAALAVSGTVWAQAPAANPGYTTAEYGEYTAANAKTVPAEKIAALEAFITKYNNPTLMPFVYAGMYQAYYAQKDYAKTIETIDKLLALGDKVTQAQRLSALVNRAQAYNAGATTAPLQTPEMLTKTRDSSTQGLTAVAALTKPANMTDAQFDTQKKTISFMFDSVSGTAASYQKDWKAAVTSFKAALVLNPDDAITHYRLGAAYLQDNPPQANDGFWELGRSLALKIQGTDQVKQFMRGRLIQYQQPGCEKSADEEINQVLTATAAGAERPGSFNIPSAQDLMMARDDTANFLPWLQEGGSHANTMWLATCGLEFPDVAVRVMEVVPGDAADKFTLKVFRAATEDEMKAASEPNMELHIAGEPDVKKLNKDDFVRFTGTLSAYQAMPFLLTWDEAKVNAEDLQDLAAPGAAPGAGRGRGGAGRGGAAAPGRGRGAAAPKQ